MGTVGESYAIEAARRMELPTHVLSRADALLDDESRRLIAMQQRLEEETERARVLQVRLQGNLTELEQQRERAADVQRALDEEVKLLRSGFTDKYLKDLKEKERQMELLLRKAEELAAYPPQTSGGDAAPSLDK
eukprot:gene5538-7522_t